ncbi:aminotransferase [Mesorhizobium xinjiangense]|uniref:aminotransferase n=1 Tax=Mesorhizobium xinjiangense TaxID=2678685 RepID=UPI0012EDC3FB|nr:aminotransferase [Mesorhizobium xinjiangense]
MSTTTSARLNPLVARLAPPPVPAVQAWARGYDGARGALMDLSQAVPGYPPHPDLLAWLAEAAGSVAYAGYGPIEGEPALREAYAGHVAALYGGAVAAGNIHVTAGCNQAFFAAVMALARAGDAVLMTNPCYFNHETTLAMLGIETRYVDCAGENGFLPEPTAIADKLDGVKALALVSPNNPTGAVYRPDLIKQICDLCAARGVWLILDETYRDFLAPGAGAPHGLLAEAGWEKTLIQLYSFSKSFCIPGHRVGAVTASEAVIAEIAKVMDNLQICAPRAPQAAIARGLPALADWRAANRAEIGRRAEALRKTMAGIDGWALEAVGAYFGFVRHPFAGQSSQAVAEKLARERGVLTIPGEYFGTRLERYLRFAFANADADALRGLKERLAGFSM